MAKCPHCADCFNCPLRDCALTGTEITERQLLRRYIDGEYYMALDFHEYKMRMENAGTKIVK